MLHEHAVLLIEPCSCLKHLSRIYNAYVESEENKIKNAKGIFKGERKNDFKKKYLDLFYFTFEGGLLRCPLVLESI